MHTHRLALLCLAMAALAMVGGCAKWYAEDADREVYGIVRHGQQKELGYTNDFTIDNGPSRNVRLTVSEIIDGLPLAPALPEMLAKSDLARASMPLRELDLATALRLGRINSRAFQTQKETVYLAALELTTQEYVYDPHFALTGSVDRIVEGPDRIRSLDTNSNFSITQQLATGASLALDLGLTGVRYLNHEFGTTLANALSVSVSQPLWRGSDPVVVTNNLVQAQRNTIYQLRDFAHFERSFAVQIATSYYNVLQQLDVVSNEWDNYNNLIQSRQRGESLAEAGRLPNFEVDQARQDELRAHNRYLVAIESYEQQLDTFRILIGLPTDAPIVLSRADLERLSEQGVKTYDISSESAIVVALNQRLDLKNARQAVEDADREAYVAADALKGSVNLVGGMQVNSTPETNAGRFLFHDGAYDFGLDVDAPLDKLRERNAFRRSLINYDVSLRDYMSLVDSIKQDIRQSLRRLKLSEQTYVIQKSSVELAQRRVASTRLLLDAGRASTRDLLDSQDALVQARNALSQALVSHLIARLNFARDLELLQVDEDGQIHAENTYDLIRQSTDIADAN